MKAKPLTLRGIRGNLKEMAMLGAIPLKIKACRTRRELLVIAPSDLGNCVATIVFTKAGNFIEAAVCEPGRWAHCVAEGLTTDQALDESMRYVDTFEDVQKFLKRQPYEWDGKRKWMKAIGKD